MLRPTILVGIGSGGLRSVEAVWKLTQEIPSTIQPTERPLIRYIYLETDGSNRPISDDIVCCPLTLENIAATQNAIQSDLSCTTSWLEGQRFPQNVMSGAGGSPIVGRLTIWEKNNRNQLTHALNDARAYFNKFAITEVPLVYVVGSFGGGTGSGTFLDIAYIIRDVMSNHIELQGLFLVPNMGLQDKVIYSNTVCCIKELEYFNDERHEFPFKWNANPPRGYEAINTPYDLVQIISAAYDSQIATVSYSQLHEEAGIFLYLNALGMYNTRRKSLVDLSGNQGIKNYTTYGLAAIHFPETEIKEILGNKFGAEMLEHIVDEQKYYDKDYNQKKDINESFVEINNRVRSSFDDKFKEVIKQWCNLVKISAAGSPLLVEEHISQLAEMLSSGNHSYDEKRKHLYNYFRIGGEYYKQLINLQSNSKDALIDLIISEVKNTLQKYQNLYIARNTIETIDDALTNILQFWAANGYQTTPVGWDTYLKSIITEDVIPMPTTFKLQLETKKVYNDRITYYLLYGLAMHIFSETVEHLLNALKGNRDRQNVVVVAKNTNGDELPSVFSINNWIDVVKNVVNSNSSQYLSCRNVEDSLRTKLSRPSGNIEYVYPQGDLDSTLKTTEGRFVQEHGLERSITDITGSEDLYTFLLSIPKNEIGMENAAERDLYKKVVVPYTAKIDTGDFTVSSAVESGDQDMMRRIVGKALIPHLPINPYGRDATFTNHKNCPHILVGYNGVTDNILRNIDAKLTTQYTIHDFQITDNDRNSFSHIGLKNWLIFYKEFGCMSDGKAFNIINDLKDFSDYSAIYYADLSQLGNDENATKDYHKKRMPYISYDACKKEATDYVNAAIRLYELHELEEALQCYKFATYWDMANPLPRNRIAEIQSELNKEDSDDRTNRYIEIADRYFGEQNYPSARLYYRRALKTRDNDTYIRTKLKEIDKKDEDISRLLKDASVLFEQTNVEYESCIRNNDVTKVPTCLNGYKQVIALYEEAERISRFDENVKSKIAHVNRYINNLNQM